MKPPTDLEILEKIYDDYYSTFASYVKGERTTKIFVPINIISIADHFSTDPDIIFGRLYYHLEKKYGYTQPDGSKVHLFTLWAGDDKHAVQFPLLAAVIAELREERNKYVVNTWLSIIAIVISTVALIISTQSS